MSCKHKADISASPEISYSTQVEPIIINNCAQSGCHDSFGEAEPLTNYNEIVSIVDPGKANKSQLYTSIISRYMPPKKPMTDQQVKLIYIWIMQGAKNN